MFKIPNTNKKFRQSNLSDRLGNLTQTKNISFDEPGYIKLEKKMRTIQNTTTMADFFAVEYGVNAITWVGGDMMAVGSKNAYETGSDGDLINFTKNTDTAFPTVHTGSYAADLLEFDNKPYFGMGTDLYLLSGGTWSVASSENASVLCLFPSLNQLAFGQDKQVQTLDTSDAVQTTMTLPDDLFVTSMAYNNGRIYIGTYNVENGKAALVVWDGLASSFNSLHEVPAHTIFAVTPYKDGVALVTSDGELLYFRGSFQKLDTFPINNKTDVIWQYISHSDPLLRKINKRALLSDGDKIYIGVETNLDSSEANTGYADFLHSFPSGLWCYDPAVGLHHKFSIDDSIKLTTDAITTANVNTTTNVITVAGATVPATGTPVFYYAKTSGSAATAATPLVHGTKYYTIYATDTTLKLATTYANAVADTAIDITGTGNNLQFLEFDKSDSFGGIHGGVTALMLTKRANFVLNPRSRVSQMVIGGVTYDSSSAGQTDSVLATAVTLQENRGYFITSRMDSGAMEDVVSSVSMKYKNVDSVEDKIVVKYRTAENALNGDLSINDKTATTQWTDGNTFTTTVDISAVKTRADAGVFDEIEIVAGNGAGVLAHITSITESSGTYTVNIDETVPNITATDPLWVVYSNWTKLDTITSSDSNGYKVMGVGASGKWIQFKIELRGEDVAVEELLINNKPHVKVV